MELTHIEVTLRNPQDPEKSYTAAFLVDTGA